MAATESPKQDAVPPVGTREHLMGKDLRASVHKYFEEFGSEVGEAVFKELEKPGGMPKLLRKLGVPSDGTSAEGYAVLIQYFRRKGTKDFLQLTGVAKLDFRLEVVNQPPPSSDSVSKQGAYRGGTDRSAVVPLMLRGESSRPAADPKQTASNPPPHVVPTTPRPTLASLREGITTPSTLKNPTPVTMKPETPPPLKPPTPAPLKPPTPAPLPPASGKVSPYSNVDNSGFPRGPLISAPSPDPATVSPDSPAWDPTKPHDPTGVWPEVERRSGRERRRHSDRRLNVDVVYKNRRYGKDRRTQKERRKNWPRDGFKQD
jgi:hypothetical protein